MEVAKVAEGDFALALVKCLDMSAMLWDISLCYIKDHLEWVSRRRSPHSEARTTQKWKKMVKGKFEVLIVLQSRRLEPSRIVNKINNEGVTATLPTPTLSSY